jgi:GNAT superfamily N-acetyltransferase
MFVEKLQEDSIELINSKNFDDYTEIIDQLSSCFVEDTLRQGIMKYCGIIPINFTTKDIPFWKLYIIKYKGETAGITGLYIISPLKDYWISYFGILREFWGTMLSERVISKLIKNVKELGAEYLYLYTDPKLNSMAIKLYKKLGFEYVSTVGEFSKNNDSIELGNPDEIVMRKKI